MNGPHDFVWRLLGLVNRVFDSFDEASEVFVGGLLSVETFAHQHPAQLLLPKNARQLFVPFGAEGTVVAALLPLTFRPLMFEVSFHRNMETLCRGQQELEELEQRHELTIPLCLVLLLHDAHVKVDESRPGDMYLAAILTGWSPICDRTVPSPG